MFAIIPISVVSLILSTSVGVFSQIKNIPQTTTLQQNISSETIALVYSTSNVLCSVIFSISLILFSILSDKFSVNIVFVLSSLCLIIVTGITKKYSINFE